MAFYTRPLKSQASKATKCQEHFPLLLSQILLRVPGQTAAFSTPTSQMCGLLDRFPGSSVRLIRAMGSPGCIFPPELIHQSISIKANLCIHFEVLVIEITKSLVRRVYHSFHTPFPSIYKKLKWDRKLKKILYLLCYPNLVSIQLSKGNDAGSEGLKQRACYQVSF